MRRNPGRPKGRTPGAHPAREQENVPESFPRRVGSPKGGA